MMPEFRLSPAGESSSLASATRICHPPLSAAHGLSHASFAKPRPVSTSATLRSTVFPPTGSKASLAASSLAAALASPSAMASCTASCAALTCVMRLRASSATVSLEPLTAVCSRYPTSARCATLSSPASCDRSPDTQRRRVDLPHPFAPTRPTVSPGSTRRLAPTSKSLSPTVTRTSVSVIIAPAVSPLGTSAQVSREEHAVSAVGDGDDACARHLISPGRASEPARGALIDRTRARGAARAPRPMARGAGASATKSCPARGGSQCARFAARGLGKRGEARRRCRSFHTGSEGFQGFQFRPEPNGSYADQCFRREHDTVVPFRGGNRLAHGTRRARRASLVAPRTPRPCTAAHGVGVSRPTGLTPHFTRLPKVKMTEPWRDPCFDPSDLSSKREWEQIGDGSFGNVYKASLLGTSVAVKEIGK